MPNIISFLGVTVQLVINGQLEVFILDFIKYVHYVPCGILINHCGFCRLTEAHTGVYLRVQLITCLKDFGINKKILALTANNASNNDIMVLELESLGGTNSAQMHIRCFAYVWNLVVKVCWLSGYLLQYS